MTAPIPSQIKKSLAEILAEKRKAAAKAILFGAFASTVLRVST